MDTGFLLCRSVALTISITLCFNLNTFCYQISMNTYCPTSSITGAGQSRYVSCMSVGFSSEIKRKQKLISHFHGCYCYIKIITKRCYICLNPDTQTAHLTDPLSPQCVNQQDLKSWVQATIDFAMSSIDYAPKEKKSTSTLQA